jgi:hypothetical protein
MYINRGYMLALHRVLLEWLQAAPHPLFGILAVSIRTPLRPTRLTLDKASLRQHHFPPDEVGVA